MDKEPVLFLHGFASSSQGTKAKYLQEKFAALNHISFHAFDFNPTAKDFQYMTITGLVNRLRQYLLDHRRGGVRLIGSSLGALVALHYAHRFGGVQKMLFLAPALSYLVDKWNETELEQWREEKQKPLAHYAFGQRIPLQYEYHRDGVQYSDPIPPPTPMMIIHGRHDSVVPIERSRVYAAQFHQVQLIELDSDHRLNDRLDRIWEQVQLFLLG